MKNTIIALATPPGTSALAIIRVSGPQVQHLIHKHFKRSLENHKMALRHFYNSTHTHVIDQLSAVFFKGPQSFTGEDTLELFPHGNPLICKEILKELLSDFDVRLAEPGEFSRRSLENGKIDLIQAEAIGQLIHATSEAALKNAHKLLKGELSDVINELIETVKFLSAKMELMVDFAEEDADPDMDGWDQDFAQILKQINQLELSFDKSEKANRIPKVVLFGSPNAGKSSLINALIAEDRLLVSPIAGTTRDYIEIPLYLSQGEILLVDTAGLGQAVDELDFLSQQKTKQILEKAQLKLYIHDCSLPLPELDQDIHIVFTKKDIYPQFVPPQNHKENSHLVSSSTLDGVDELKDWLSQTLFESISHEEVWMSTQRQFDSLKTGREALLKSQEALHLGFGPEILAFELQQARDSLMAVTGHISSEDILNRIFSGFCIGK